MGKIITVANKKGGVGKSTTVINLAAGMGIYGKKVLVVDMDPQGNATSGFGIERKGIEKSVYDVIIGSEKAENCIIHTEFKGIDVLPSEANLAGADLELRDLDDRAYRLKMQILPLKDIYDYIIIDSPPSTSLITVNTLTACDSYLIPMQCEFYSLEGIAQLMDFVKSIKQNYNPSIELEGILFTMFDPRLKLTLQVKEEIEKHFEKNTLKTVIPRNVRLSEAPSFGCPVYYYDKFSKGAVEYTRLAAEILKNNGEKPRKTKMK